MISDEQQQPPLTTDETANQQVQLPSVPPDTVTAVHARTTPPMQQLTVHHSSYDHAAQASSSLFSQLYCHGWSLVYHEFR
jgi:hypothetical protein